MVIVNQSKQTLSINGKNLYPTHMMTIEEMSFNTQFVLSDAGAIEIVTEYSKRKFRWFGDIFGYEHEKLKDSDGLSYIMIVDCKGV